MIHRIGLESLDCLAKHNNGGRRANEWMGLGWGKQILEQKQFGDGGKLFGVAKDV
jgi:hypothetical protein